MLLQALNQVALGNDEQTWAISHPFASEYKDKEFDDPFHEIELGEVNACEPEGDWVGEE